MYKQFQHSIQQFQIHPNDSILLAVSGGVDSMVLLHLCHQLKLNVAVAHCNFQLREEAKEEERFVQETCKRLNIPFHCKQFETKSHQHGSIQMVARDLRYEWFRELCTQHNYKAIATAHHLNDQIETVLLNLTKGTSIKGITGIPTENGLIIRPLLFAAKEQIYTFAKQESIAFKEDVSNQKNDYQRNKIRNLVVPILKEINPSLEQTFAEQLPRFQLTKSFYKNAIDKKRKQLIHRVNQYQVIYTKQLYSQPFALELFYELIAEYGFASAQVKDLFFKLKDAQTGASFTSATHQILKDRERILIFKKKQKTEENQFIIQENDSGIQFENYSLCIKTIENPQQVNIDKSDQFTALLDAKDIEFPLVIRKWLPGDYFYPFGLGKKQKLKKFFVNQKFSKVDKKSTYLLCSGSKIIWIMPHRIDNRFKITDKTKKALQFSLRKQKS